MNSKRHGPMSPTRLMIGVILAIAICGGIIAMSVNVVRDLRLLNSASSDNVQWTLSQAEVEFLEYELYLVSALQTSEPDLALVRREFDIFYSRVQTLQQSSIYEALRAVPSFSTELERVQSFLRTAVPIIDSADADLIAGLPDLLRLSQDIRPSVRSMSNSGLNYFAQDSDARRNNVSVTLMQLAVGVTVLLLALLLLALYLMRLNNINIRRRSEVIEASKRMNIVTSTALDAVVVSSAAGFILDFNAAAEQIFGYTAEEAVGETMSDMIVPDHHRAAHEAGMERMRANGEKRVVGKGRVKLEAKRKGGEVFPCELAIQSAQTDEGEIFIAFLRDISHRVRAEQDLVEARDRALAGEKAKTDFLATMSHEIRTPLNGLLGNLALLEDTRLSPRQARYIKNMDTSGKLLMNHISDVLDITKYDAGKLRLRPVAMNISNLLQDIIDNQSGAASAHNTTLKWGWLGTPAEWIEADPDRIQHILMNVIGNAVKFTRDGNVSVTAEVVDTGEARPDLRICISDTGIGMDDTLRAQIFDDFMTGDSSYDRDTGGTGLGLGIAKRFVTALGGTITVESEVGKGSIFTIQFPIDPIEAVDTIDTKGPQDADARAMNILLVEDNEINRVVAREMLMAAGHTVTEAQNGRIAVDMAEAQRFDLILMDISMPVMDGRSATKAIRAGQGASATVPIVALTANAMAEEQQAFLKDGMNEILTKPLTREGLMRVTRAHVPTGAAAAADVPTSAPAVMTSQIAELRDNLGDQIAQTLLDRFVGEVDAMLEHLAAHETNGMKDTAEHAHRIAGSAAAMGATDLRQALIAVENAAKRDDVPGTAAAIDALPDVWSRTRPFMRADLHGVAKDASDT
ncbi:ATP-binding protein [Jannaschia sp. 2305UL9-9]|uniref:PAS domain-containing hybrid sensor histidine kinase/response regulator n=1 Tax=Jannaschia sp. 2305UL9-9 TaxID=3121638 RepID=UPI0035283081